MINVLFIAYHFPPIGGAGVQRTVKFVRYLPDMGYLPVIVTGPGSTDNHWTPNDTGLLDQISSDVRIYRIEGHIPGESPSQLINGMRFILFLSRNFSKWWVRSATKVGEKALSEQKIDLIYASMSPFESAVVAGDLSRRFGIPWVADLRDPWVLDEMQVFYSAFHRKVHLNKMHSSLSSASAIIMNTPEATSLIKHTFPDFAEKKIVTITNGFDTEDFSGIVPSRNDKKFRIVHSGYLHAELGLDHERKRRLLEFFGGTEKGVRIFTRSHIILLKSVEDWLKSRPSIVNDLEICFVGAATGTDMAIAKESSASSLIHFAGYAQHAESLNMVRTANLLFLPMHKVRLGQRATIVPGKLYEYMASGRPILAAVPDGDAKDYLLASGTALICDPDNPEAMGKILDKTYDAWKRNEPLATPDFDFIAKFERKVLTKELSETFRYVLEHKEMS